MSTHHTLEISNSSSPDFTIVRSQGDASDTVSAFELSLFIGVMVHPAFTVSVEESTSSVSIEWYQEYPM